MESRVLVVPGTSIVRSNAQTDFKLNTSKEERVSSKEIELYVGLLIV